MPSVYHWGGRSLDEAKISQAEQARAGEAICRPSDRSATPAAATWTAASALALALRAAESGWTRPVVLLGAGGALVAVGMGLAALPNATPRVPAVAAAAVQVAAAGVALRSLGLQMASPALACSALSLIHISEPTRLGMIS